MLFKGLGVAIVTPFNEKGIDFDALKKVIESHIENQTQALFVLGTTGENPSLSEREKEAVFKAALEYANHRIMMIANTGDNNTQASIERSLKVKAMGYDGLLLVVPYYNKPQQRGLIAHFEAIVNAVQLPSILYNVPGRTSLNMELETLLTLTNNPYIVGVKEASHNDEQIKAILNRRPQGFGVYCGNDDQNQDCLEWGADGLISVTGNLVPKLLQKQCVAMQNNDVLTARALHNQLKELHQVLFIESNPVAVKFAMNALGQAVGKTRLPLVDLEEAHQTTVLHTLQKLKEIL